MAAKNIVVLGAGVAGLTTAKQLSQKLPQCAITVVAKSMPGDYDIEYASPWAGANFLPFGAEGTSMAKYEAETWPELARLAQDLPEAGIHFQDAIIYERLKDLDSITGAATKELSKKDPWYRDVVPRFRPLDKSELPAGVDSGQIFGSVCINTALYLPWLASQCLKHGVKLKRGIVNHILDARLLHSSGKEADIIVNCSGLSAMRLGGVEDTAMYPARGQIVVVRNESDAMYSVSGADASSDEFVYIMHRAAGGGCILGGCYQKGNWESQPDLSLAARIMARCVELNPALTGGKGPEHLSIIRHGVGLRPAREGGARVEKEKSGETWLVHNYGHGGSGYQTSYGSANAAVKLVEECLD